MMLLIRQQSVQDAMALMLWLDGQHDDEDAVTEPAFARLAAAAHSHL